MVEGKTLGLAEEVRRIQRRAADHAGRIITIGQLVLFSTETGDAWLLDRTDRLAARLGTLDNKAKLKVPPIPDLPDLDPWPRLGV